MPFRRNIIFSGLSIGGVAKAIVSSLANVFQRLVEPHNQWFWGNIIYFWPYGSCRRPKKRFLGNYMVDSKPNYLQKTTNRSEAST